MSIILQFIQYYGDLNIHHYDSINIYNDIVYKTGIYKGDVKFYQ